MFRDPDAKEFAAYLRAFIVPTLILKVFVLYFGINYSARPGEGYGWGLIITLVLSTCNFAYFLYREHQRPPDEAD